MSHQFIVVMVGVVVGLAVGVVVDFVSGIVVAVVVVRFVVGVVFVPQDTNTIDSTIRQDKSNQKCFLFIYPPYFRLNIDDVAKCYTKNFIVVNYFLW